MNFDDDIPWAISYLPVTDYQLRKLIDANVVIGATTDVERAGMLAMAFKRLTPRQQQCMELYFRRRYPPSTIARKLGIDRSSVRIHLKRGATLMLEAVDEGECNETRTHEALHDLYRLYI